MYIRIIAIFIIGIITLNSLIKIRIDNNKQKFINVEVQYDKDKSQNYQIELGTSIDELIDLNIEEYTDIRQLNKDINLYDNQKIIINEYNNDLISINDAELNMLISLPGIGETIGKRIIEYRNNNGKFEYLEELMFVKGIGKKKYETIKGYICL